MRFDLDAIMLFIFSVKLIFLKFGTKDSGKLRYLHRFTRVVSALIPGTSWLCCLVHLDLDNLLCLLSLTCPTVIPPQQLLFSVWPHPGRASGKLLLRIPRGNRDSAPWVPTVVRWVLPSSCLPDAAPPPPPCSSLTDTVPWQVVGLLVLHLHLLVFWGVARAPCYLVLLSLLLF